MPKRNMKKFIPYNLVLIVILILSNCKTAQISNKYPDQYFTISFYSIGTGIDQGAKNLVDNTINSYKKKGHPIICTTSQWGREGEIDYCFTLQNLAPEIYKTLGNELSTQLNGKQVHIKEKTECKDYKTQ